MSAVHPGTQNHPLGLDGVKFLDAITGTPLEELYVMAQLASG